MCYPGYMAYKDIARGPNGVRRRRVQHDDETRRRIQITYLINRLTGCVRGEVELSLVQLKAAEILLKKALPDMVHAQITGELQHNFVECPQVLSEAEFERRYCNGPRPIDPEAAARVRAMARADTDPHASATADWKTIDLVAEKPPDDKGKLN
jgi:hypothetical protein